MAMGRSMGDARGGELNVPGNVRASALRPENMSAVSQHVSLSIHLDYQFKLCYPSSIIITSELL